MPRLTPLLLVVVFAFSCTSNRSGIQSSQEPAPRFVASEADLALIAAKIESDAKSPEYESMIKSIVRKENLDNAIKLAISKDNLAGFLKLMEHGGLSSERIAQARIDAINSHNLSIPFYMHLLSMGVDLSANSQAVLQAPKENLIFLLRYGAKASTTNAWKQSRLHFENDAEIIEILIQNGADPNLRDQNGEAPLHMYERSVEAFKKLIELGADPNLATKDQRTPIFYIRKSIPHLEILMAAGADPNAQQYDGTTILHWYVRGIDTQEDFEFVKALIHHGADVSITDIDGITPLFNLTSHVDTDLTEAALELLLRHGADINHQSKEGWTVVSIMAGWPVTDGHSRKLQWLLSKGARTDLFSKDGYSPLSRAARLSTHWLALFLNAGVDINQRNPDGNTALFYAFRTEAAKYLIDHGADPTIRNAKGQAAFEFPISRDFDCKEYLHIEFLKRSD